MKEGVSDLYTSAADTHIVNGRTYIRPAMSWQIRLPVAARSVTTTIAPLILSPMVLQDVDMANDGGTGRYIYRTAKYRRRLQTGRRADKCLLQMYIDR
jgi:hypothetical protein